MVNVGDIIEMSASPDEFIDVLKEFQEGRREEIQKNIDGKTCICNRTGASRGFENQGRTICKIKFEVIKVLD